MAKNLKQSRFKKTDARRDAVKDFKKQKKLETEKKTSSGILFVDCPACGFRIKYKRGRKKNPSKSEVLKWLDKARCPKCGQPIRVKDSKGLLKGKGIERI